MEDILASIRRIIADDQLQAGRPGLGTLRRGGTPSIPAPVQPDPEPFEQSAAQDHHDGFEEVLDLARMPEAVVPEPSRPQVQPPAEGHTSVAPDETYADEPAAPAVDHSAPDTYANGYAAMNGYAAAPTTSIPLASPEPEQPAAASAYAAEALRPARSQELQPTRGTTDELLSPQMGASVMSAFETLAATVVLQNDEMLDRVMHDLMRPLIKSWLDENLPTLVERLVRSEIERVARGGRR